MTRTTYLLRDGELVEKGAAHGLPDGHGPNVISDVMNPIRSMADGRLYDSKSAYRASLRARGCVEVGNERARFDRRPSIEPGKAGADIRAAIEQLRAR